MKKYLFALIALTLFSNVGSAGERKMLSELPAAVEIATKEDKLIFIKYGRESCGNCRSLKRLINERKVKLFDSEFVLVDLDCDKPEVSRVFNKTYRAMLEGSTKLPFVIIAKPDGTPISAITGYKDADAYNKFVSAAKKQAKFPR